MEGLYNYKSFDSKKNKDIDISNQPELLEQARQFYIMMSGSQTSLRASQGSKTPQPSRPPQTSKNQQQLNSELQQISENLTTNQTDDQSNENQNSFECPSQRQSSRPCSGRRLRSQRIRGKTPTSTQVVAEQKQEIANSRMFEGIQTMDDFANMLLAKHEQNKQLSHTQPHPTHQQESKTNLFAKTVMQVTVNDEEQSMPEICQQIQMLDNSTLPLDDDDFNSSPRRNQIRLYEQVSPQKYSLEESLEIAVQRVPIQEQEASQEESEEFNDQGETRQIVDIQRPAQLNKLHGHLTSIKEYNESQENMMTDQTTSPSRQIEFVSLRCDENEQLVELYQHPHSPCKREPEIVTEDQTQDANEQYYTEEQSQEPSSAQCEENFASQSPIKQFHVEEAQAIRASSPTTTSGYPSPDKVQYENQSTLQGNDDLSQVLHNQRIKDEEKEQLMEQITQLSQQLLSAQSMVGSLERQLSTKDIALMQNQLNQEQLCQQLDMQTAQHELHVTQMIENQTQTTHKLHLDFEVKKKQQNDEHEKVVKYFQAVIAQTQDQAKQFELMFKQKEQQALKLRQDNQNMFADLKQLAQSELQLKNEVDEAKNIIQELELHANQLTDSLKQQNQQFSEQFKAQQQQIENLKSQTNKALRDTIQESEKIKAEASQREQQLLQEIQQLRDQNQILATKTQAIELERVNAQSERERKNNELRQMHQELQKMSTVISGMKHMQMASNQFETNVSGNNYFGVQRATSAGKHQGTPNQIQRPVLQQNDLNQDWTSVNYFQTAAQPQQQEGGRNQSPYKKTSVTPHPTSPSPLKGRMDPNMAQYARRQNLNLLNQHQDFESIVQEMNLQEMQGAKQKMEAEYARIPIILTGKSLQIRKRKEELEYELDLIEKYIGRAKGTKM